MQLLTISYVPAGHVGDVSSSLELLAGSSRCGRKTQLNEAPASSASAGTRSRTQLMSYTSEPDISNLQQLAAVV